MAGASEAIGAEVRRFVEANERKDLLRFITCGSVDDGKSTLIGRLLYEAKALFEDQLAALESDSKKVGTQQGAIDYALLVDGLAAEREQGITIDVAYRYFSTEKRAFIVADTPGHEQYTRNMATGASTADVAIILIDARKGVLTQTRRHSYIVSLLGIRKVVLAINKMDLVDFARDRFDGIVRDYAEFARQLELVDVQPIPLSALCGDNVIARSAHTPWYEGPTLMGYLEGVELEETRQARPLRMPVQWVCRPSPEFRGFAGLVTSGSVTPGQPIKVLPSGKQSRVARIVTQERDLERAVAGQSVVLTLADEIDVSRGDVIAVPDAAPSVATQFQVTLVWMHEDPMLPGRSYLLKIGSMVTPASITATRHRVNVNSLEREPAKELSLNEIGVCNLATDRPIAFDPYVESRETGGFILIDRLSNDTVGAGMINFALRRADNIHVQTVEVDREARARMKGQQPMAIWFTGLSGSGKSTIANALEKRLHALGRHTYLIDGDNVRHGLNRDLGFTDADRVENVRRVAEVTRLMLDAGLIVLVSLISPLRADRRMARALLSQVGTFVEVFVDTPLEEAERRDVKGLYKKARAGQLKNFTGIDSPYEAPEAAEIHLRMTGKEAEQVVEEILAFLESLRPNPTT